MEKNNIKKPKIIILSLILFLSSLSLGIFIGLNFNKENYYNKGFVDGSIDYWSGFPNPESTDNYLLMRDIFTPMYNDTVTIKQAGYRLTEYEWINNTKIKEGGYLFWVNHTCDYFTSFYYDDAKNYKILIPTDGKIIVLETNNMESEK